MRRVGAVALLWLCFGCANSEKPDANTPGGNAASGSGGKELTRDAALAIIKADPQLLGQPRRVEVLVSPDRQLWVSINDPDILSGKTVFAPGPLQPWRDFIDKNPSVADFREYHMGQALNMLYYRALIDEKFITWKGARNGTTGFGKVPELTVIFGPGERLRWTEHPKGFPVRVDMLATVPMATAVTGITGDERTKQVEAEISDVATPEFKAIRDIAEKVAGSQTDLGQFYANCKETTHTGINPTTYNYPCAILKAVRAPRKQTFYFQLYDDGWRLVQQ